MKLLKNTARLWATVSTAAALNLPALAASNPYTGDDSMVGIMIGVAGIALVGIIVFFVTGKKKK